MNILILAANGRIARIVEQRILSESKFAGVNMTLVLRNSKRLSSLSDNPRVKIIEGDIADFDIINQVMAGQDMVYISCVDVSKGNAITENVIRAMRENKVTRLVASNAIGIYDEVPGDFGRTNREACDPYWRELITSERLVSDSSLDYTIIRLPWLSDKKNENYEVTTRYEKFYGDYVSRRSVADLVLRIVADPNYGKKDSLAVAGVWRVNNELCKCQ